jgi:hypothetical protein
MARAPCSYTLAVCVLVGGASLDPVGFARIANYQVPSAV